MSREEEIEKAKSNYLPENPFKYMDERADEMYNNYAKAAEVGFIDGVKWADENPKNLWISVNDKQPKEYEYVIIHRKYEGIGAFIGYFFNGDWYVKDTNDFYYVDNVNYWMPIPPIPQEGGAR